MAPAPTGPATPWSAPWLLTAVVAVGLLAALHSPTGWRPLQQHAAVARPPVALAAPRPPPALAGAHRLVPQSPGVGGAAHPAPPPPPTIPAASRPTDHTAARLFPWVMGALTAVLALALRPRRPSEAALLRPVAMAAGGGRSDFRRTRVFVQNVPEEATWDVLKHHFAVAGTVAYASISTDENGRPKGQGRAPPRAAIVQYETAEEAANAIKVMRNYPLLGATLFVREDLQERSRRGATTGREWTPGGRDPATGRRVPRQQGPLEWMRATDDAAADGSSEDIIRAADIAARLRVRENMRSEKRYEEADTVRQELRDAGVTLDEKRRIWRCDTPVQRNQVAMASVSGVVQRPPIGTDGLKALLERAAATLGPCRFIVTNMASGGILEAVQDFGAVPLRYSQPREGSTFCTLGTKTFECHLVLEKIGKVVFANPQRPRPGGDGTYSMYVVRFLDRDDKVALSVLLHSSDFERGVYAGAECGKVEGWKALVAEYGETVVV